MAQNTNEDNSKQQNAASDANSEDVSDYAFDFLYNSVPFGEYPEANTLSLRESIATERLELHGALRKNEAPFEDTSESP